MLHVQSFFLLIRKKGAARAKFVCSCVFALFIVLLDFIFSLRKL